MKPTSRSRTSFATVLFFLAACGGSAAMPPEDPGLTGAQAGDTTRSAEQQPAPDPWATTDEAALRALVRDHAAQRIAEAQPDFQVAQLDAYIATPNGAPEIAGRTVERLFDLAAVALAEDDLDRAEGIVRLVRARAKNRNSAYAGTTYLAEIARRKAGEDVEAQKAAIAAVFRELPLPRFGSATVVFQLFQRPEQLSAQVEQTKTQMLSLETASAVVFFGQVMPQIVANRDTFLAAIESVRAENARRRPPREYRFSTVDVGRERGATEVRVGVWDLGTNPELFAQQMYANANEQANGRDDDGNGLVDDIHGVVFDDRAPNTALLFEPGDAVVQQYAPFLKGIMDLRAGLASTEDAQRVLELMRGVTDARQLVELERNLDAIGEWAHGTHVAGIMLAGNPHARLAVFRSAWAGETRTYFHRGPTDQELALERANAIAVADFINANQIRVVNASLGFSQDYLEDQLRHERDRYQTDAQVRARAEQVQAHRRETWRQAIARAPQTLFVFAAGNSNRDVLEYGDVPADTDLPNLIAVGAVDRWGNWATFTNSNTERVRIFDFGVEVPSLIPDGRTVPLSGTSMASPNVANLAAKMLAVAPSLTPEQLIEVIVETGDPIAAPFDGRIANERRALTKARQVHRQNQRQQPAQQAPAQAGTPAASSAG